MFGSPGAVVFASLLTAHGSVITRWPIKTVDISRAGSLCDPTTERYLKVHVHDYHDHPRVRLKMHWRPRAEAWDSREEDLEVRTAVYDVSDGDEGPTDGRVQLDLFVCVPYGEHSLQLNIGSYGDGGSTLRGRTTWMAEDGLGAGRMRGTGDATLIPGSYTWYFEEKAGSYRAVGPRSGPSGASEVVAPAGRAYKGLFSYVLHDHTIGQLFGEERLELPRTLGCDLRTQACSLFCRDYEAFAILDGDQCFCGTGGSALDVLSATHPSTSTSWWFPVSAACGTPNMVSVYRNSGTEIDVPEGSTRSRRLLTPMEGEHYQYVDCYNDVATFGLMSESMILGFMSSELCFYLCYSLSYPRFGMKNGIQCGCGAPFPDANTTSPKCNKRCSRNWPKICGGKDQYSVYEMLGEYARNGTVNYDDEVERYEFLTCSYDANVGGRLLSADEKSTSPMSAEICYEFCNNGLNNYFGTEFASECFCQTSLIDLERRGLVHWRECGMLCARTTTGETCGANSRISIYRINRNFNSGNITGIFDEPGYQGCYLEDASDRVMTYAMLESEDMTNQLCKDNCEEYGFTYSGTQMGDECWCGNALGVPSSASSCDLPCAGDSNDTCGGDEALTVFNLALIRQLNVTL